MEKSKKDFRDKTEGRRIGIFGASGCGKTHKGRELISKCNRLIVFDSILAEWRDNGRHWLPSVVCVDNVFDLKKAVLKRWYKGFKIVFVPTMGREKKQLDEVARYILAIQNGFGITHNAKLTFLIDEAQECIPSGTALTWPTHGAITLARMGRKKGINLLCLSQRIKTVDINLRANLNDTYIFRLEELADINEANQIIHDKTGLLAMKDFDYYLKSGGQIKFFKKS